MKIFEYIEKARSTALYGDKFTYPALGLCGESGELIDKLTTLPVVKDEIILEVGDLLWYIVNVMEDADLCLFSLLTSSLDKWRDADFTDSGNNLLPSGDDRAYYIKLAVHCGRINEIAKKALRDTNKVIPEDKKPVILDSVHKILESLYNICNNLGIDMNDVAGINIAKLFSRKERGVIGGSGDLR